VSSVPANRATTVLVVLSWLALFAAGIILATSFLVDYPDPVLNAAWLVALAGLAIVMVSAWRQSRSQGGNYLSTLGRTLKAAGRFVIDFF
jgi:hypothetical protein